MITIQGVITYGVMKGKYAIQGVNYGVPKAGSCVQSMLSNVMMNYVPDLVALLNLNITVPRFRFDQC